MLVRDPVVLVTERLILRPFREDDWSAVHEYAVDPEISKFQEWGPNSETDTKSFVAKCMRASADPSRGIFYFSIALVDSDRHVGGCALTTEESRAGEASIGYAMSPKYWRQGFATEAAAALIGFGFVDRGLRRITANCDSENVASSRVMEKIGMRLIKTEQNARFFKNSWRTWLEYAIDAPPKISSS